jgi:hypothetical protein
MLYFPWFFFFFLLYIHSIPPNTSTNYIGETLFHGANGQQQQSLEGRKGKEAAAAFLIGRARFYEDDQYRTVSFFLILLDYHATS